MGKIASSMESLFFLYVSLSLFLRSRGFGFVNFKHEESAVKAITEMNAKEIMGRQIYVGLFQRKDERLKMLKKQFAVTFFF